MSRCTMILIIDFGSQYTQLIARRVREHGVYCEVLPYHVDPQRIKTSNPLGIILSGGPETVTDNFSPRAPGIIFELGCPILGICYGMQTIAEQLGGKVAQGTSREFGSAHLEVCITSPLFKNVANSSSVWMSHNDHVEDIPTGFEIIAKTSTLSIAAIACEKLRYFGLQFHPEVTQSCEGSKIIKNFISDICKAQSDWNAQNIVENFITDIQSQVKDDKVILALSGGVDSTVMAALLHKAIGNKLSCIFVDHGFLRTYDTQDVIDCSQKMGINLQVIDASEQFFSALQGISDPEQKRKIIGREFISVFEQAAKTISNARWLAQGTIYPDVIESAAAHSGAHVIKSHHNVGGLPDTMNLKLLEPLRTLFKDEVRKIGIELGLPEHIVYRHPFPGPGLALRVLGELKRDSVATLRHADTIFINELRKHDLYHKTSQAFAVFLPVSSVGVMGDQRKYDPIIALRAVETTDFMTARYAKLPGDFLESVANKIVNEVHNVSRVVYDITGKPPATIEWE